MISCLTVSTQAPYLKWEVNKLKLCAFFWAITRRLNFICQRFGLLCLFYLHRRVGMKNDWGRECWGINTGKGLAGAKPY